MRDNLFRHEVLQVQHDHFFGDAVFYQPLTLRILLLSIVGLFFVLAGFAASAAIKQTENVRGFIYASNGEVKVYGNRSGIIQHLHISNGQLVHQGQTLASMIEPGFDQEGDAVKQVFIRHIEQQISQINDRLALSSERQLLALEQSENRRMALDEELLLRTEEVDLSVLQLQLAEEEFRRLELLRGQGAISVSELTQGSASLIAMRKSVQSVRIAQQSATRQMQSIVHDSELEQARFKDEQITLGISLSQLQQRRDEALYEQGFTLTAPVSGKIDNLLLTQGDQIDVRRPFVSIVADMPLYEAQIFVSSRALGKIEAGQTVLLNYDAFPYQQYGSYEAIVSSIGTAAIDPREHLIPLDINEPVYLIKAELMPSGHDPGLRSGMQFSAQLVTGERTILQGIMEPLTSLARRL